MESQLKIGTIGKHEEKVVLEKTAAKYGSGLVEVYATPAMIALMEKTAMLSVIPYLPQGHGTVGTEVNIKHLKATPIGQVVTCESELIETDGRKLVFKIVARDEEGEIGHGTHTRFIIDTAKFMAKLQKKN